MDFLRFHSRTPMNMSKRFPTKESYRELRMRSPETLQLEPNPHRTPRSAAGEKPTRILPETTQETGVLPDATTLVVLTPPTSGKSLNNGHASSSRTLLERQDSDFTEADFNLNSRYHTPVPDHPPASPSLEDLCELLFSEGFLETLTTDARLVRRFSRFLSRYRPGLSKVILQYLETQKVLKAVHYANAVASAMETWDDSPAAEINTALKAQSDSAFETLLGEALPAWVTYNLVKEATFCLSGEITHQNASLARNLVHGFSEVFCLTDPNLPDNPIIYASQEFYRVTGYGRNEVIGFNCRFLQGPRTSRASVQRLQKAIHVSGDEISETLLNYRRDGTPFVNVLMMAPLLDDKGEVKYYLGAQVDASKLVEAGAVEGFEQFVAKRELERQRQQTIEDSKQVVLEKLRDLSLSFDLEESAIVQDISRETPTSHYGDVDPRIRSARAPGKRRFLDLEDIDESEYGGSEEEEEGDGAWNISAGPTSGNLPGLYKKYILCRPLPSLRAVFVSQAAKTLGNLQQHPFLAHVAAPVSTLVGLRECFETLTPVTAKVSLMPEPSTNRDGTVVEKRGRLGSLDSTGRVFWISATPLLNEDSEAGVWMIVIMDSSTGRDHVAVDKRARKPPTTFSPSPVPTSTIPSTTRPLSTKPSSVPPPADDADDTPEKLYLKQQLRKAPPPKNDTPVLPCAGKTLHLPPATVEEDEEDSEEESMLQATTSNRLEEFRVAELYGGANSSTECLNGSLDLPSRGGTESTESEDLFAAKVRNGGARSVHSVTVEPED